MRTTRLVMLLVSLLLIPVFAAEAKELETAFDGQLRVVLYDALWHGDKIETRRDKHLVLWLEAREGRWQRVWGMALGYNNGVHEGFVTEQEVGKDTLEVTMNLRIGGDLWIRKPERLGATVTLKRDAEGHWSGAWRGNFKQTSVKGDAEAWRVPDNPVPEGFRPVRPGEHPRMLFRRHERPALRKKLRTPIGQGYLKKALAAGDIVSLGMIYQLTGDERYAAEAEKVVRSWEGEYNLNGFGSGGFGHRVASLAFAYDLCYDQWDPKLRAEIVQFMRSYIPQQHLVLMEHSNFHPCSNYYGPGRTVAALCTAAIWGEKGPKPEPPKGAEAAAVPLPPAKDYTPPKGVPVVDFEPGATPDEFLVAGPLKFKSNSDVLQEFGGYAKARPKPGDAAKFFAVGGGPPRSMSVTFARLEDKLAGADGLALGKIAPPGKPTTVILYTVLKVSEARAVGYWPDEEGVSAYLAGKQLNTSDFYKLSPGLYPLTLVIATRKAPESLTPCLCTDQSDQMAPRRGQRELDRMFYRRDLGEWKALDGADARHLNWFRKSHRQVYWHYRLGIGDGGFQAETGGYADIASWYPLVYAGVYRTMTGRDASPHPDVSHLVPRRMMQVMFGPDGSQSVQKLNSCAGFRPTWAAAAFPLIPEEYKSGVLWAWHHVTGAHEDHGAAVVGKRGLDLALSYINHPTASDGELSVEPKHPDESMPNTWRAEDFGFYVFRSGWKADDFIAQVFAKAMPVGGWNHPNAGAWRLRGLGHTWNTGPTSRNGVRPQESVVLLPEDETHISGCAQPTHLETAAEGSASLTMNMNDVYGPAGRRLHDKNHLKMFDRRKPGKITGLRAMAFDYSGASGAEGLMVLVDKISGGGKRLWTWQVPGEWLSGGVVKLEPGRNGFTIDHGEAKLVATFVTPEKIDITAGTDQVKVGSPRHGYHGPVHRIKVAGTKNFFLVATIQRGDAPTPKIDGKGLDAKVTIGKQTVRFDGEKIVLD